MSFWVEYGIWGLYWLVIVLSALNLPGQVWMLVHLGWEN